MSARPIDAFLAYNEREYERVSQINDWLEARGIATHFWRRDVKLGDSLEESRQLDAARSVVVLLGQAGWGPTHINIATAADAHSKPLLPVLIGRPPEDALDAVNGLFRKRRYLEVAPNDEVSLEELRRRITDVTGSIDGRLDYLVRLFIDGNEVERRDALAQIRLKSAGAQAALARRLRELIKGRFSPGAETDFASAIRDPKLLASARSWMLSALLECDAESAATRELVLQHIGPAEPDLNVKFWALAGLVAHRASYLKAGAEIAVQSGELDVTALGRAISAPNDERLILQFREQLSSRLFKAAREVLRVLRVFPMPSLVEDVCKQLLRRLEDTPLAYDVLYALANPVMAPAAAAILTASPGVTEVVRVVVDTAHDSNRNAIEQFTQLLLAFDQQQVRTALELTARDVLHETLAREILRGLDRASSVETPMVPIAGYASDSVASQSDQLGIQTDVQTLAAIVTARQSGPPLAIGLFGDWGSGKTFFMRSMREAVARLAGRASAAAPSPYCSAVVQIGFNAWHYVDSNLWATLVQVILEKLAQHVSPRPTESQQQDALISELASAKAITAEAESEKERVNARLRDDERELLRLQEQRREKEVRLADIKASELANLLADDPTIKNAVDEALRGIGLPSALNSVRDLEAAVEDARSVQGKIVAFITAIRRQRGLPPYLGLFFFVLVVIPFIAYLIQHYATQLNAAIVAVGAVIAEVTAAVAAASRWIGNGVVAVRDNLTKFQNAKAQVDALIANKRTVASAQEIELSGQIERLKIDESKAQARLTAAATRVGELEARLQSLKEARSLARFLSDRTSSDDYRKHLGLISTVRQDFEELAERLSNRELLWSAGNPVERIVLYIDDLDRCPAEKVVDVLQAVHLLLAYPLFVVVVGVDSRWLLQSLASHFAEFESAAAQGFGNGEEWGATPQHYLEKIFQIPYTLGPMTAPGYSRLIGSIMEPSTQSPPLVPSVQNQPDSQVRAPQIAPQPPSAPTITSAPVHTSERTPGPTPEATPRPAEPIGPADTPPLLTYVPTFILREEALVIQPWEMRFAQSLFELIPSPRAAKRLANTYRVLKARVGAERLSRFEGSAGIPGEFQIPLVLLALLIASPHEMAKWFPWLKSAATVNRTAAAVFLDKRSFPPSAPGVPQLLGKITRIIEADTFPGDPALLTEWIPQVARFSFYRAATSLADERSDS